MIPREKVAEFATRSGFGGETRRRNAVRLERFAGFVAAYILTEVEQCIDSIEVSDRVKTLIAEVAPK